MESLISGVLPYYIFIVEKHEYMSTWQNKAAIFYTYTTGSYQGNLKGESVVAAILLSGMEVSYCTSRFFVAKPARSLIKHVLPFSHDLAPI